MTLPPRSYHALSTITLGSCAAFQKGTPRREGARDHEHATLVHAAGRPTQISWPSELRAHVSCLDAQLVTRVAEETGVVARVEILSDFRGSDATTTALTAAFANEARLPSHPAQLVSVTSMAIALACRLLAWRNAFPTRPRREAQALDASAIARVRRHLLEAATEPATLEELARVARVDPARFCAEFPVKSGTSPAHALLSARIDRAREVLAGGQRSVEEVAATFGFSSVSHFERVFRRLTGLSPHELGRHPRFARLKPSS